MEYFLLLCVIAYVKSNSVFNGTDQCSVLCVKLERALSGNFMFETAGGQGGRETLIVFEFQIYSVSGNDCCPKLVSLADTAEIGDAE